MIFPHEAGEGRLGSAESLGRPSMGECHACKINCRHFFGPLVRHLESVVGLGTVKFAEKFLFGHMLRGACQSTDWVVFKKKII